MRLRPIAFDPLQNLHSEIAARRTERRTRTGRVRRRGRVVRRRVVRRCPDRQDVLQTPIACART